MDALRRAAEAGDPEAMSDLGATYAVGGEGLEQDYAEAFLWFTRSAEVGSSLAKLNLAGCYRDGRGCDVDEAKAMALYLEAASDPSEPAACDAMEHLGEAYRTGTCGVPSDQKEAARWFRRGADAGSVECAYRRGVCLATGEGASQDVPAAVEAFRLAAASGHAGAALDLGHCLMRGLGVAVDQRKAVRAYAAAADAGHPDAAFHLGMAHLQGRGATQQERSAARWLLVAAEAGHPEAMHEYASLVATGAPPGVAKDVDAAVRWYALAAAAGVAESAAALGAAHCAGIEGHVARDLAASARWFERSFALGMPEAGRALREVRSEVEKEASSGASAKAREASGMTAKVEGEVRRTLCAFSRIEHAIADDARGNTDASTDGDGGGASVASAVPLPDGASTDAFGAAGYPETLRNGHQGASRAERVTTASAPLLKPAVEVVKLKPQPRDRGDEEKVSLPARKPRPEPRGETASRAAVARKRSLRVSRDPERNPANPPKPPAIVKPPSQGGSGKSKKPKDPAAMHPDSPYAATVRRLKP
jgi:TPR repeat protein